MLLEVRLKFPIMVTIPNTGNIAYIAPTSKTYYWSGVDAEWGNLANWTILEGSTLVPATCLPSINDDVYFTADSYFGPDANGAPPILAIPCNVRSAIRNFNWINVSAFPQINLLLSYR